MLVAPAFMMGFTKGIDEDCSSLGTEEQARLKGHDNYNPRVADLVNQLAEGIKDGRDLSKIEVKFNAEVQAENEVEIEDLTLDDPPLRDQEGGQCWGRC